MDIGTLTARADGPLAKLWDEIGLVLGSLEWNLSVSNPALSELYVSAAGQWISDVQDTLGQLQENDQNPAIDALGARFDVIVARRGMLVGRGFGQKGAGSEALREFWRAVQESMPSPRALGISAALVAVVVLVILLR